MIYQPVLTVFQIILCRFAPSQFLLIIFTQLNLKSFVKYAIKKKSSQVRESEKIPLEVQHIKLCHPDYLNISLMTECELGDTCLKKLL